jgi:hypothetical protein
MILKQIYIYIYIYIYIFKMVVSILPICWGWCWWAWARSMLFLLLGYWRGLRLLPFLFVPALPLPLQKVAQNTDYEITAIAWNWMHELKPSENTRLSSKHIAAGMLSSIIQNSFLNFTFYLCTLIFLQYLLSNGFCF